VAALTPPADRIASLTLYHSEYYGKFAVVNEAVFDSPHVVVQCDIAATEGADDRTLSNRVPGQSNDIVG
jgi:hypothetical protein